MHITRHEKEQRTAHHRHIHFFISKNIMKKSCRTCHSWIFVENSVKKPSVLKNIMAQCGICYETLEDADRDTRCSREKCTGAFHKKCMDTWLRKGTSCPNCRYELKKKEKPGRTTIRWGLGRPRPLWDNIMAFPPASPPTMSRNETAVLPMPPVPDRCRECGCTEICNENPDQVCTGCGLVVWRVY